MTHPAWRRTPVFCIAKARQYMKIWLVSARGRRRNVRWEQRRVMRYVSPGTIRRGWATMAVGARGVPSTGVEKARLSDDADRPRQRRGVHGQGLPAFLA